MKIGFSANVTGESLDVAILAPKGEELGYDSFWLGEHPVFPLIIDSSSPYGADLPSFLPHFVDMFIGLARASSVTRRLKLGTSACLPIEHHPVRLAKEISTLDRYSGGRVLFGIGMGWLTEQMDIMGGDFQHRYSQTREAVQVLKELWTKEESEFHGKYYDFPRVISSPKPVQVPHPPILLGSNSPNVFRRVVEWADGWFPTHISPEDVKEGRATLNELAAEAGRDPSKIDITIFGVPGEADAVRGYEEAGTDRVIYRLSTADGEAALEDLESTAAKLRPWMIP